MIYLLVIGRPDLVDPANADALVTVETELDPATDVSPRVLDVVTLPAASTEEVVDVVEERLTELDVTAAPWSNVC